MSCNLKYNLKSIPLLSACLLQYHIAKPCFSILHNILYPKRKKLSILITRDQSLAQCTKIMRYHTLSLITDPRTSDQIRPRNARGDPLLRNSWATGAWFEFNTFSPMCVRSASKFGKFSVAGISGFTPSNGIPCANSEYIRLYAKRNVLYIQIHKL